MVSFFARTGYLLLSIASTLTYIRVYLSWYISQRLNNLGQWEIGTYSNKAHWFVDHIVWCFGEVPNHTNAMRAAARFEGGMRWMVGPANHQPLGRIPP